MTSKQVGGAVVILSTNEDGHPSLDRSEMKSKHQKPHGIVTKTDILHAYRRQDKPLVTCKPGDDRDRVASIIERNKMHHVIVMNEQEEHFIGIVSSLDIAKECARDNRAWPYLRSEDGRVHLPRFEDDVLPPAYNPHLPTSIVNHKHDEVTTYMDDLDLEAFQ